MAIKKAAIDLIKMEQEGPHYSFRAATTTDKYQNNIVPQIQAMARRYQTNTNLQHMSGVVSVYWINEYLERSDVI